ncbi:succinylglutamate desuccinylase/aspartoacylase family protein [Candidatus Peregrinibacteria bacterium]|nr:MAG: succinylglutamate desuccinylase/aspartoacylase family protein [Candidatus Peregrinibacteria bacterium]
MSQSYYLNLDNFEVGTLTKYWLPIVNDGIGEPIRIPMMVAKGKEPGPVVGLTAALHGNELNGIPVIQKVFQQLDLDTLKGTVVGVLTANVPGVLLGQRRFNDDVDLNWIAPGKPDGNLGQIYMHRILYGVVKRFDTFIDLHTVSFGRASSHYIFADMTDPETATLAQLQNPAIIVHSKPNLITLRGQAAHHGIKTITAELKDPYLFQDDVIEEATVGIKNVLVHLKMQPGTIRPPVEPIVLCEKSSWLFTDEGGLHTIHVNIGDFIKKGDLIAEVKSIFNESIKTYHSPNDGIVVAINTNPVGQAGSRTIHLGFGPTIMK